MDKAKTLARESLQEARRSVWDLLPQTLEEESLTDAIKGEVDRFAGRGTETANFDVSGATIPTPSEVDAALLRICQEALMNVRKYAQASRVDVILRYGGDSVTLTVHDNGAGFEPSGIPSADGETSGGFGLTSMRQRASLLGGTFDIKSERGHGTQITATINIKGSGYTTPLTR